jgi:hypothetical protein
MTDTHIDSDAGMPNGAWLGPTVSARSFIDMRPSVLRLLALVLITDLIFYTSLAIKMTALPIEPTAAMFQQEPGFWLVLAFVGRTVFLFALAIVLCGFGRLACGSASIRKTLTGVIWGAMAAVPLAMMAALLAVLIGALQSVIPEFAMKWVTASPYLLSLVAFVWFVTRGAAEAHGLKYITPVFVPTMVLTVLSAPVTIMVLVLTAT